jgi:hypothetical protein
MAIFTKKRTARFRTHTVRNRQETITPHIYIKNDNICTITPHIYDNYIKKYDNNNNYMKVVYVFNINTAGIGDFFTFFNILLHICIKNDTLLYLHVDQLILNYIKPHFPIILLDDTTFAKCIKTHISHINMLYTTISKKHSITNYHIVYPSVLYGAYTGHTSNFPLKNIFYFHDTIIEKALSITDNKKYISVHLRLGDKFLEIDKKFIASKNDVRSYDESKILSFFTNNNDKNIYFFCDNNAYRQKIKQLFDYINITDLRIGHSALSSTSNEEIFNSILEFYIMSNSEKIYKCSRSGFSEMASRFNNVEYCKI